ncbi:MAG: hypothetical protein JST09_02230 [Bacteroidetes bacterium]|nr:hypothetical protein [Bacteroidota bacterium]
MNKKLSEAVMSLFNSEMEGKFFEEISKRIGYLFKIGAYRWKLENG